MDDFLYLMIELVAFAIIGAAVYLICRNKRARSAVGINLKPPKICPNCSEALPFFRFPKSFKQALVGGWTCSRCHSEIDKWGTITKRINL
ncbi:hypothetical protein [Sphingobium sp. D43FB]|uniref:hypothetical protein n=1 Tax=Sphingobium sp. D43FB TaxID=2017595 RepID=UPI00114261AD|nr:hypothetical protein [Sphingobium sp. D43FB]